MPDKYEAGASARGTRLTAELPDEVHELLATGE
jgi:hypothetical protein